MYLVSVAPLSSEQFAAGNRHREWHTDFDRETLQLPVVRHIIAFFLLAAGAALYISARLVSTLWASRGLLHCQNPTPWKTHWIRPLSLRSLC